MPFWDVVTQKVRSKGDLASKSSLRTSHWVPATLLGMAMVARGEIGLLIIQLGLNDTSFLSEEAFLVAIWAIVLNTIIGPVAVGLLLRKFDKSIAEDPRWGMETHPLENRSVVEQDPIPLPQAVAANQCP